LNGVETVVTEGANFQFNSTGIIAILIGIVGVILPLSMELLDRKKGSSAEAKAE